MIRIDKMLSALSRPVNAADDASSGLVDPLLTSKVVRRDLGDISEMCLWRWTRDRGFPPPDLVLGKKKLWHRGTVQSWIEAQKAGGA